MLALVALTLAGILSTLGFAPAIAADSFTVRPATALGPDNSRSSFDFGTLSVGASKTDYLYIQNGGDRTLVFAAFARYAYPSDAGASLLIGGTDDPAYDAADWLRFGAAKAASFSVALTPGKSALIPITVTIPTDAYPGSHSAAIVVATATGPGQVVIAKRTAIFARFIISASLKAASAPVWTRKATFYEMNIRNFTPAGTFPAAKALLPQLDALGIGAIVLDPIFPIGTSRMVGTIGSIDAVTELGGVNPSLGTLTNFNGFVSAAHALGIQVVMKIPLQYAAVDHPWTVSKPNWFDRDANFDLVSPAGASYLAEYDYTRPELRQAIIDKLELWSVNRNVDGFIFDNATSVPLDFINELSYRLQALSPVLLGTTDSFSTPYLKNSLTTAASNGLLSVLNNVDAGTQTASSYATQISNLNKNYSGAGFAMNMVSNYDTMVAGKPRLRVWAPAFLWPQR